jgi:hypothetical protein
VCLHVKSPQQAHKYIHIPATDKHHSLPTHAQRREQRKPQRVTRLAGSCCWNLWARGIPRGGARTHISFCPGGRRTPAELEDGSLFRKKRANQKTREPQKVRSQREDREGFREPRCSAGICATIVLQHARVRLVTPVYHRGDLLHTHE